MSIWDSKISEIPFENIPEGIRLCLKNCVRHKVDGDVLMDTKRYQSGLVSLMLSVEELSKIILLFEYYKKKKNVPQDVVAKYFRDHKIRLRLFDQFFSYTVMKRIGKKYPIDYHIVSHRFQREKELLTYVDWTNEKWESPENFKIFKGTKKHDISLLYEAKYGIITHKLTSNFTTLIKDPDFTKIIEDTSVQMANTKRKIKRTRKSSQNFTIKK